MPLRRDFEDHLLGLDSLEARSVPAVAVVRAQSALRSISVDFPDEARFEALGTAFRRFLGSLADLVGVADCHACEPVLNPSKRRSKRPRQFWVLWALVALSFIFLWVALLSRNLLPVLLSVGWLGATVGGVLWSASGARQPLAPTPCECNLLLDSPSLLEAVGEALAELDDTSRMLVARFSDNKADQEAELPPDVLALVHRLLGDGLTGRLRNRSGDLADLLESHQITVVENPKQPQDHRFAYRIGPNTRVESTLRPALVTDAGKVLIQGSVLIPEPTKAS